MCVCARAYVFFSGGGGGVTHVLFAFFSAHGVRARRPWDFTSDFAKEKINAVAVMILMVQVMVVFWTVLRDEVTDQFVFTRERA